MSARVLLTGAAGFLGAHCLAHLLDETDWHIVCPVTFRHKGLPERIIEVVGDRWDRVDVVKCDLSCPISAMTEDAFGEIDYVINYAAQSHVARSIANPVQFVRDNVDIALNLMEYARATKPRAFIHISTDEVYGPAALGHQHAEWDPILPSSPYSASKAAQEAIAISYWRTYDVPLVLVNCMNLIGEMQDPEKYTAMIITKVLRGEKLSVHASADGEIGSRFYLHARALADAVLFLTRRPVSRRAEGASRPDRWNVVGERELDNLELAQLVAKLLGRELDYELVDYNGIRPGHDMRYALDGSKIAEAGWVSPISFDEGLDRLIRWSLARPEWANPRVSHH